ncbi:MAG: hypothetical protein M0C28_30870 [Candidatus Moduliflexus flocculans]|nr:hypothetical protein [Candidatus Moduliflexus flocculans]
MMAEHSRAEEAREQTVLRKNWGPYPGERQTGHSARGQPRGGSDARNFFTPDRAGSSLIRYKSWLAAGYPAQYAKPFDKENDNGG